MTAGKSLWVLLGTVLALVIGIATFNFAVDPQCYYRCSEIDVHKRTLNTYYQVAQRILAHPDAEVVILGSSRGESIPPLWVQEETGLKTLNLSSAGAEVTTKLAFLKIAEEKTNVRKVIWLADYFELVGETQDAKIKNTPALRKFLKKEAEFSTKEYLEALQGLISHNSVEAAIYFLNHREQTEITQGAGSALDYKYCESAEFKGNETAESLKKEIDLLYHSYTHGVINPPQSEEAWTRFATQMHALATKGIEVSVILIPYHPDFLSRLKIEKPDIYIRHEAWVARVKKLESDALKVVDNFEALPDSGNTYLDWNDGVHFNCRASMNMLRPVLAGWK